MKASNSSSAGAVSPHATSKSASVGKENIELSRSGDGIEPPLMDDRSGDGIEPPQVDERSGDGIEPPLHDK